MSETAIQTRHFQNQEAMIEAAAALLRETIAAIGDEPAAIMLSGGSTPLPAYKMLAADPPPAPEGLHFLFSDERMAPFDSPENNCHNVAGLFHALGLGPERVLRVETDNEPDEAARIYEADLEDFLDQGGRIPLGLLGMGADGHTASLFSIEDIERARGRLALEVQRPSPPHRVSVSPTLLNQIERIVFLVAGRDKDEMVVRLLKEPQSIPAGRAVADAPHVELWLEV